jgi:hypothetical protein
VGAVPEPPTALVIATGLMLLLTVRARQQRGRLAHRCVKHDVATSLTSLTTAFLLCGAMFCIGRVQAQGYSKNCASIEVQSVATNQVTAIGETAQSTEIEVVPVSLSSNSLDLLHRVVDIVISGPRLGPAESGAPSVELACTATGSRSL